MPNLDDSVGRERRFAGGIGAKKVDVSVATEEAGLVLAVTLKGIYYPDKTRMDKDGGLYFAKNLMNRKGDLLSEATTLHKRFPYAVIGGVFLMDERADRVSAGGRLSTYRRAHQSLAAFAGRETPADADELIEALVVGKIDASGAVELSWAGQPAKPITLDEFLTPLLKQVAERNGDHYEVDGTNIIHA